MNFDRDLLVHGVRRIHAAVMSTLASSAVSPVLARMLLLSLAVHLVAMMIVQPRRYHVRPPESVIVARLMDARDQRPVPVVVATPAPLPEPVATVQVEAPVPTPVPIVIPESPPKESPPKPVAAEVPATVPADPQPQTEPAPPLPATEPEPAPPAAALPSEAGEAALTEAPPRSVADSLLPELPVMLDTTWYEARDLDVSPTAARRIQPGYPPSAVEAGIEGTVKLMLRIDEFGEVREVEVVDEDPPGVFGDSAVEAFKAGQFNPARRDGQFVRALIYIRVFYQLRR